MKIFQFLLQNNSHRLYFFLLQLNSKISNQSRSSNIKFFNIKIKNSKFETKYIFRTFFYFASIWLYFFLIYIQTLKKNKKLKPNPINMETDSSYQEDILKVKKIWKDIKQFDKQHPNVHTNAKSKIQKLKNNKQKPKQKTTRGQFQQPNPTPQVNTNSSKRQTNDNIIQFSTSISPKNEFNAQNRPKDKHKIISNSQYMQVYELNKRIQKQNQQLSLLRINNQRYKDVIRKLQQQSIQKDSLIKKLKGRQHQLLGETNKFNYQLTQSLKNQVEYTNYKNDARRLLKMLQSTQQYQYFANFALEDDGVRFLHEVNKSKKKSIIDLSAKDQKIKNIHFCTCNKQFLPQHNFWVPEKAYNFSKQFAKQKAGQILSHSELELLLYELNKIWRERQKRIVNYLNSSKAHEVGKYKRKVQNILVNNKFFNPNNEQVEVTIQ